MSGRPREFDSDTVLLAAMEAFWLNGYEATSAQQLVESTGLGRGSLYGAFGSKQQLYQDALRRYLELTIVGQSEILNAPGTVKERLSTLMRWGIDNDLIRHAHTSGCLALFSWFERIGKDPVVEELNRNYIAQLEPILCQLFTEGQKSGEINSATSPLSLARAFMSSYFGLRLLGRSMPDRAFLEDVVEGTIAKL